MKKIVFIIAIAFTGLATYAQKNVTNQKDQITKYVTTFPNGDEAITVTDQTSSSTLKLASSDDFYKYEILESSNHELVHGEANRGKICDIDKSKLEEGTYTLKVYTDDFVITSDITISGGEQNLNGIVQ